MARLRRQRAREAQNKFKVRMLSRWASNLVVVAGANNSATVIRRAKIMMK